MADEKKHSKDEKKEELALEHNSATSSVNPLAIIQEATRVQESGKELLSLSLDRIYGKNQKRILNTIEGYIQRLDYLKVLRETQQNEMNLIGRKLQAINNGDFTLDAYANITFKDSTLNDE